VYSAGGACTVEGLCIGLEDTAAEEVAVLNTAPVLFLLGPAAVTIDKAGRCRLTLSDPS